MPHKKTEAELLVSFCHAHKSVTLEFQRIWSVQIFKFCVSHLRTESLTRRF